MSHWSWELGAGCIIASRIITKTIILSMHLLWDIMTRIVFKMVRNLVGCQQCQILPCSSNKSNLTNTRWWRDFVQSGGTIFWGVLLFPSVCMRRKHFIWCFSCFWCMDWNLTGSFHNCIITRSCDPTVDCIQVQIAHFLSNPRHYQQMRKLDQTIRDNQLLILPSGNLKGLQGQSPCIGKSLWPPWTCFPLIRPLSAIYRVSQKTQW